jgi:membrane protease YdiL (CAAX protease family)
MMRNMSDSLPQAPSPDSPDQPETPLDAPPEVLRAEVLPPKVIGPDVLTGEAAPLPAPRRPTGDGWVAAGEFPPDPDADSALVWNRPPGPVEPAPWSAPEPIPGWGPPENWGAPQPWGPPQPWGAPPDPAAPQGWRPPPGYPPGYPQGPAPGAGYGYGYDHGYAPPGPYGYVWDPAWGPAPKASERWMGFDPFQPKQPRWGMPDILLGLLAFLVASIAVSIPVLLLTKSKGILGIVGLLGSWTGMVGYLWFVSRKKGLGTFRDDFGFRFQWIDPLLGFGMGLFTIFLAGIVGNVVAKIFESERGSNVDQIFDDKSSAAIVVITAILAAVGAPIVEELFFRGLTLRSIERRLGPTAGIIGSAAVFGLLHFNGGSLGSALSLVSAITIFGLVFAFLTRWQGRLGPSIFAHMTINSLAAGITVYKYFGGTIPT